MMLFSSEGHVDEWLTRTGNARGAVVPIEQVWRLAKAWYVDPRDRGWKSRTRDEAQAVLSSVGLTDAFWELK